ncbi:unnamed protein product, partial [Durusdinium trenchii]
SSPTSQPMDAGETFRSLLRSLEAQYDEDIHYIRCGRRSMLHRKSTRNLEKLPDESQVAEPSSTVGVAREPETLTPATLTLTPSRDADVVPVALALNVVSVDEVLSEEPKELKDPQPLELPILAVPVTIE